MSLWIGMLELLLVLVAVAVGIAVHSVAADRTEKVRLRSRHTESERTPRIQVLLSGNEGDARRPLP
jgi:hypothetical protein